ncbi:MAG TPA: hypothetical protein DDZ88_08665 [Verrucomicrobiales bacterium]|nr:hypothetical protein [Verrucomicrobiales bacterium]
MSHRTETIAPLAHDVPFDFEPVAGVPFPVLFQTEDDTVLIYRGYGVVVAHFDGCLITRFGYPNDEALGGHPLYASGLRHYGVFEVHGSSWPEELETQNRRVFPDSHSFDYRHFIFTFHDSTFECLAAAIRLESFIQPLAEVVDRVQREMCARLV